MARDLGLEITLFQPFRDFEGMPEPLRSRTFDRAERKFDLMQELGTDLVLVCSNVSPAAIGGIDRAADDFRELGERAARRNLRVGYEALAWGRHISDHRDAWEIVRRADHPNVGLILDSFHTLARKIDVNSIRSIPKDKLFIIQMADAPLIDMDLLYWSRHYRNMPGEGDLPVLDFMRAVAATGYDGYFSLEIFNDQFRGGSPATIAADGRRSLIYLGDQVRRVEPDNKLTVAAMPPRAKVHRVGFVEFATHADDAERLVSAVGALGFKLAGKHRTKDVALYRQGDINLVINTDTRGFASSAYAVHGTAAYAMGLVVDDAAEAHARAVAMGAESFEQPLDPGEIGMPAIRGVGGGLVYFLDEKTDLGRIFDIEFEPVAGNDTGTSVGLTHIDHVAQTMKFDELLTWLLFYTSLTESRKSPMVDIVDPGGVVRSQVVENDEERCASRSTARKTVARWPVASLPRPSGRASSIWPLRRMISSRRLRLCATTASIRWKSRRIITTIWKRVSVSIRNSPTGSRPRTCFMIAMRVGNISSFTARPTIRASFRSRAEARLQGIWRSQCDLPHCGAAAIHASGGHAKSAVAL